MMTGRLTGTLDGRPVVIEADNRGLTVVAARLQTLLAGRRLIEPLLPGLRILKSMGVPLRVGLVGLPAATVLPKPSAIAVMAAPVLARLA